MKGILPSLILLAGLGGLVQATGGCFGKLFCKPKINKDPYGLGEINKFLEEYVKGDEFEPNVEAMSQMLKSLQDNPKSGSVADKLIDLIELINRLGKASCGPEMSSLVAEMEQQIPIEYTTENRVQQVVFWAFAPVAFKCSRKLRQEFLEFARDRLDIGQSAYLFKFVRMNYLVHQKSLIMDQSILLEPDFFKNYAKYQSKERVPVDTLFVVLDAIRGASPEDKLVVEDPNSGKLEAKLERIPRAVEKHIVAKCEALMDDGVERDVMRPTVDIIATFYTSGSLTHYPRDDDDLRFMIEAAKYMTCQHIIATKGKSIVSDIERFLKKAPQIDLWAVLNSSE